MKIFLGTQYWDLCTKFMRKEATIRSIKESNTFILYHFVLESSYEVFLQDQEK